VTALAAACRATSAATRSARARPAADIVAVRVRVVSDEAGSYVRDRLQGRITFPNAHQE